MKSLGETAGGRLSDHRELRGPQGKVSSRNQEKRKSLGMGQLAQQRTSGRCMRWGWRCPWDLGNLEVVRVVGVGTR